MTTIQEYQKLKSQLAALEARLEILRENQALQKDLEFYKKLHSLLTDYEKSPLDVVSMIIPSFASAKAKSQLQKPTQHRTRKTKTYINPRSGERIETKGGNHRTLKAWKLEHGNETVESWLQP